MLTLFIDETKNQDFVFVGCLVPSKDLGKVRRILKGFLLPGQRSIHFHNESHRRRRKIIGVLLSLKLKVLITRVKGYTGNRARSESLEALVKLALKHQVSRLVLELDSSSLELDLKTLAKVSYLSLKETPLPWDHMERHHEPLLWVADAFAWCLNRGGEWERIVRPMIIETIEC
jgi:hypothetical protein